MIFDLGGIAGWVRDDSTLTEAELASLARFRVSREPDFELFIDRTAVCLPGNSPATGVDWSGGTALLSHRAFTGLVDTSSRKVRFHAAVDEIWPLHLMLRAAATILLPSVGWLPLHAAAIKNGDGAVLFLGPSGAGKSTLVASSPYPVLTDEMALLSMDAHTAAPTIFWGDAGLRRVREGASLATVAIIQLRKGESFSCEPLSTRGAMAALVASVLTPVAAATSERVMSGVANAATSGRCAAMTWHKSAPPWDDLADALARGIRAE